MLYVFIMLLTVKFVMMLGGSMTVFQRLSDSFFKFSFSIVIGYLTDVCMSLQSNSSLLQLSSSPCMNSVVTDDANFTKKIRNRNLERMKIEVFKNCTKFLFFFFIIFMKNCCFSYNTVSMLVLYQKGFFCNYLLLKCFPVLSIVIFRRLKVNMKEF